MTFRSYDSSAKLIADLDDPVEAIALARAAGPGSRVVRDDGVLIATTYPLILPNVDDTPNLIGVPVAARMSS